MPGAAKGSAFSAIGMQRAGALRLSFNRITFAHEGASPMAASALVQARIDPAVKERATQVLEAMGMTLSDAVRILLTRTAREGALPIELTIDEAAYDAWFRRKVKEALDDPRPDIAHDEVEAEFAARRAATLRKVGDA
jgi:DNA-damage-inducible protein J